MTTQPAGPVSIAAARDLPALRLVVLQGVPSPWSQAAQAILRVKRVRYTLVNRSESDAPGALEAWTGPGRTGTSVHEVQ